MAASFSAWRTRLHERRVRAERTFPPLILVPGLPAEGRAAPILHRDAEVLAVPLAQRLRILGLEEDAADAGDSFHWGHDVLPHIS